MSTRANYQKLAPEAVQALLALDKSYAESSIGHTIIELVHIRASQLNGCIFCLDLHNKSARTRGERELRLYHLALWRESSLFSEKEKAALEWTELLTQPTPHGISDTDYAALAAHFEEKEIVELTMAISAINAWNRIGVALKPAPGSVDKFLGLDKIGLK